MNTHEFPYIIAEIGFNHEGDMNLAYDMIFAAAGAGADAVKFQTFKAGDLALPSSPHYTLIKPAQMSFNQMKQLKAWSDQAGIDFLSTPFSPKALDRLMKVDIPAIKIASMDCTNTYLLEKAARTGKPILLSTGMAGLNEIDRTLAFLDEKGSGEVVLLHCISNYPAKQEDLNLSLIPLLSRLFARKMGYSDHHHDPIACLLAATLGARVIETHFTLEPGRTDGDHVHSMGPLEMQKLIKDIHGALAMLGSETAILHRPDFANAPIFRRGVYLAKNMATGEKIEEKNLLFCRPASELSPSDALWLIGRTLSRDVAQYMPLSKTDLAEDKS